MVRSRTAGFYKFPGGGIERGESHLDTLVRETKEEIGLSILPDSVRELGRVREIRRSIYHDCEIFDHTSYYYYARTSDAVSKRTLTITRRNWVLNWPVSPRGGIQGKPKDICGGPRDVSAREARVLEWLIKKRKKELHMQ